MDLKNFHRESYRLGKIDALEILIQTFKRRSVNIVFSEKELYDLFRTLKLNLEESN